MFLVVQRVFIALCLIFLAGCSAPACRQWEIQEIETNIVCFKGGKLTLSSDSDYSHLELELIRNRSGIRFYLNILFLKAPPCKEDPSRTRLEIRFDDQEPWIVYPYLLEGGQRLLLPGDVADILVQNLLDGHSFTIQIGRSVINVVPDHFSVVYARLLALPIEEDLPHEFAL
jgi:hypothetical protein